MHTLLLGPCFTPMKPWDVVEKCVLLSLLLHQKKKKKNFLLLAKRRNKKQLKGQSLLGKHSLKDNHSHRALPSIKMASLFKGELQKSHNDKREYRYLTLPNRLSVVLVHDKDTEKSSACVDVKVGAMAGISIIHSNDHSNLLPSITHFSDSILFLVAIACPSACYRSGRYARFGSLSRTYAVSRYRNIPD